MTIFYDHIIKIHHIHNEIEDLTLSKEEKQKIIDTIEEIIHHRVLHKILDKLHIDHHELFLERFHTYPHDHTILDYLKKYVPDIEHHILEASEDVKFEMLKAIRNS